MVDRVQQVIAHAVQPIPILPLVLGLAWFVVTVVCVCVGRIANLIVVAAPAGDVHIVMAVEASRVEDIDVSVFPSGSNVAFPEISMDQTRFEHTTIVQQDVEEPWRNLFDEPLLNVVKIFPGTVDLKSPGQ